MNITLTPLRIQEAVERAYHDTKPLHGGTNASYIPYLADIDPDLFGVSVTLADGTTFSYGDTGYRFGIESVSKVPTALLILKKYEEEQVLEMVGAGATGLPFNSVMALLLEDNHPSTPLVNAGAISACSMVEPIGNGELKWKAIFDNITDLCGSEPELIEELYTSESATNYNNRAIAWLLKNYDHIYDDPEMSLDLYTRQCSLGITTEQLSIMAATIAFKGYNPVTHRSVHDPSLSAKIISMIAAVGFYENTGNWIYTSGIPAKSGVGGGVLAIFPGVMGIAAFAPPLDKAGNSVKAQAVIRHIVKHLGIGIYNGDAVTVSL